MPVPRDDATLVRIAKLHFEGHRTQKEIAVMYGTSVSTISRALQQARDLGIVQIRIREPVERLEGMERELVRRFGLRAAVVVPAVDRHQASTNYLGLAVASYLEPHLYDGQVIGVSDGRSTASVVVHIASLAHGRSQVVPLLGGVGEPNVETHPGEVARALARQLGGHSRQFNAPAIVHDPATRDAFVSDPSIRSILAIVKACDLAIVGIGAVFPTPTVHHVLPASEVDEAKRLGAVGAICARFFDAAGSPIASALDDRTIGVSLEELKRTGHTVGVAGGVEKVAAIEAALRGRLVDVIATDQEVAGAVLNGRTQDDVM